MKFKKIMIILAVLVLISSSVGFIAWLEDTNFTKGMCSEKCNHIEKVKLPEQFDECREDCYNSYRETTFDSIHEFEDKWEEG